MAEHCSPQQTAEEYAQASLRLAVDRLLERSTDLLLADAQRFRSMAEGLLFAVRCLEAEVSRRSALQAKEKSE